MKRKSITRWKKFVLKSFLVVLVNYERNHIYWMLRFNKIIYRVSFIIWIKKKRKQSFFSFLKHWQNDQSSNQLYFQRKNKIIATRTLYFYTRTFYFLYTHILFFMLIHSCLLNSKKTCSLYLCSTAT